jgi:hypothetical protein
LAAIVPPSVLEGIDASTPTVPQPQPEAQAQVQVVELPAQLDAGLEAPTEAADPPVEPEARSSQRKDPSMRYTDAQLEALTSFITVNNHPTKKQRIELGRKIGLSHTQIYY